ncbi:MAG: M1 family metallopeptidase [Phycisphaerae bacterium]
MPIRNPYRFVAGVLLLLAGCAGNSSRIAGAAGQTGSDVSPPAVRIERCNITAVLEPPTHRLEATATLSVVAEPDVTGVHLKLHPDLWIDSLTLADGTPIGYRRLAAPSTHPSSEEDADDTESFHPVAYSLTLTLPPSGRLDITVKYGGRLFQDVSAGEKTGQIHNFTMRAHIGEEGVYLSEAGAWYPTLAEARADEADSDDDTDMTRFELTVAPVKGMVFVASGNRRETPAGGPTTWQSPFPLEGLAVVGGPHEVFERDVDGVRVRVHLSKDHAKFAPGLLDAIESYLRLYQPLLGPYPYHEFAVVENFFSSGFAFPGFTLLASQVIAMGEMGLRPGYLDHELLHNWWGNGVFVAGNDGNWCECLTSYCANYMRPVLEGHTKKARNQRRDICYGLSRLTEKRDKPLSTFGRDDGAGSFIGYQKGSMVFAMLADRIGEKPLWHALKRLRRERLGDRIDWNDIRAAVEAISGRDLRRFFDAWVRTGGVPDIAIDEVRYEPVASRLMVSIVQRGKAFDLQLPLRLVYADGHSVDHLVTLDRPFQVAVVKVLAAPSYVELDPDFHVMHRIASGDLMPTISGLHAPKSLTLVRADGDAEAYDTVAKQFRDRYKHADTAKARELDAADLTADAFAAGHVLVLGSAARSPIVAKAIHASPLSIGDGFFNVRDRRFDKPTDAVLCCVRNERDAGGVICIYYGNSPAALKKAALVTFYGGNSMIVFDSGKPTVREDFERIPRVLVKQDGASDRAGKP